MNPRELVDDLGAPVRLAAPIRRVVSLVPSLTEALAVSAPGLLVGATDWCSHPGDLDVRRVRGTKNPDLRAIAQLAPDLVICNQEENRQLDVQRLRAAGTAVWVSRIETLTDAFDSMQRLCCQVLGLAEPGWLSRAREIWAEPPAPGAPRSAAVPIWRDPWMVVGGRTFTGDLLGRLGVRNVFTTHAERYPAVSPTQIAEAGPELVLLPDEPYPFHAGDGPEAFPSIPSVLVSGRLLTWYGPSLVAARPALEKALRGGGGPVSAL